MFGLATGLATMLPDNPVVWIVLSNAIDSGKIECSVELAMQMSNNIRTKLHDIQASSNDVNDVLNLLPEHMRFTRSVLEEYSKNYKL